MRVPLACGTSRVQRVRGALHLLGEPLKKADALWIGHRISAGDLFGESAQQKLAYRHFHLLARQRARDLVDLVDLVGHVTSGGLASDLVRDARLQRLVENTAGGQYDEQRHEGG